MENRIFSNIKKINIRNSDIKQISRNGSVIWIGGFDFTYTGSFEYNGTIYTNTNILIDTEPWVVRFLTSGNLTVISSPELYATLISGGQSGGGGSGLHEVGGGDKATGGDGGSSGSIYQSDMFEFENNVYSIVIGDGGSARPAGNTSLVNGGDTVLIGLENNLNMVASGSTHLKAGGQGGFQGGGGFSGYRANGPGEPGITLYGKTYLSSGGGGYAYSGYSFPGLLPSSPGANAGANTGSGGGGGGAAYTYYEDVWYDDKGNWNANYVYNGHTTAQSGSGGSGCLILASYRETI